MVIRVASMTKGYPLGVLLLLILLMIVIRLNFGNEMDMETLRKQLFTEIAMIGRGTRKRESLSLRERPKK